MGYLYMKRIGWRCWTTEYAAGLEITRDPSADVRNKDAISVQLKVARGLARSDQRDHRVVVPVASDTSCQIP